MANFPTNPSVNDLVTIGKVKYKWNGVGWQIETTIADSMDDLSDVDTTTTGPTDGQVLAWDNASSLWKPADDGGDAWVDTPEDASLDGVAAFKKQSSVPSATADWAKIYSKDVFGGDPATILLHADNNLTDHGPSGVTLTTPGTYNSLSYSSSEKKFGTHSFYFDAASGSDSFIIIPYSADMKWPGDFTFECWFKSNTACENKEFNIILDTDRSGATGSNTSTQWHGLRVAYYGHDGGSSYAGRFYAALPPDNSTSSQHDWGIFNDSAVSYTHLTLPTKA